MIKVLIVNYNTPDLIYTCVESFRQFYNNDILVVDGSNKESYEETKSKIGHFDNLEIHHFGYNIHHGPGMGYGFATILSNQILVLDSDVLILKGGFLELLERELKKESYGIGDIQKIDNNGFNIGSRKGAIGLRESEENSRGIAYLHPAFMLINKNIAINWPMPVKHGAPMIETMKHIHNMGQEHILQHSDFVHNDFRHEEKIYFRHDWMGTVSRTGGYNL